MGRPELSDSEKQAKITAVRLRPTDRDLLEIAAQVSSRNLSDWMRETLIARATEVRTSSSLSSNHLNMKLPPIVRAPRETQTLLPIQEKEINGIEMGVLSDGTAYLSGRGLATMCGVDEASIRRLAANWNSERTTARGRRIAENLAAHGYVNKPLFHAIDVRGSKHHAYPDAVCMAILEYYAFDAEPAKDHALKNYRLLARSSLRAFIYVQMGYDPANRIPECWKKFHDRVSLVHHKVPDGHFSIFKEMADLIVSLIQQNIPVDEKTVPDISVGQQWGAYWTKNRLEKLCGQRIRYEHSYPDYFPQARSNPQHPWAYPDAALAEFRKWMRTHYLPTKLRPYLASQEVRRAIPPSVTSIAVNVIVPTAID